MRGKLVFEEHLCVGRKIDKYSLSLDVHAWWFSDLGQVLFRRVLHVTRWCTSMGTGYDIDSRGEKTSDIYALVASVRKVAGPRHRLLEPNNCYSGDAARQCVSESDRLQELVWAAFSDVAEELAKTEET